MEMEGKILNCLNPFQKYNARPYGHQSKLNIDAEKYRFDQGGYAQIGNPVF